MTKLILAPCLLLFASLSCDPIVEVFHEYELHQHESDHAPIGAGHSEDKNQERHDDHDEHMQEKFGVDKAIVAVKHEGEEFKLSERAISLFQIITRVIKTKTSKGIRVPSESLVFHQDKVGVYKQVNGFFKLVLVSVVKKETSHVIIKSNPISLGDKIAVQGVSILRIAHLEAIGQGGQGHAH